MLVYIDSDHHSHTMLSGHNYLASRSSPMIAASAPLIFVPPELLTKALSYLYDCIDSHVTQTWSRRRGGAKHPPSQRCNAAAMEQHSLQGV